MTDTMENTSSTNYLLHFNTVVNNYGAALLESGQGSEAHKRASRAVDSLAEEYVIAADLLDRVRGYCFGRVEHAYMNGNDYLGVAADFAITYPPLAEALRNFCAVMELTGSAPPTEQADGN